MKIRTRLTIQFVSIVFVLLSVSFFFIYYLNATYRENQFFERLRVKAQTTAKLLVEVQEVDSNLLDIINQNSYDKLVQEKIVIYNNKHEKIYDSKKELNFHSFHDSLLEVIDRDREVRFHFNEFEIIGIKYGQRNNEVYALAGAFDKYGNDKLSYLRNILIIVFISGLTFAWGIGYYFAGRAIYPISQVIKEVGQITVSNLNQKVNEGNGKDEIAQLAMTFNKMLGQLNNAFEMNRTFIANASHEIRTPLTAIKGQIELALSKERDVEYFKEKMQSVLEDIIHLSQLSNQLLSLAQINSENYTAAKTPVRIDELLWSLQGEIENTHKYYKVIIRITELPENENHLILDCDPNLIKIALFNLVENACKFSHDHTAVVKAEFSEETILISVQDNGIGIDKQDIQTIFTPFGRGKNAITYKGSGIGLSLVDRIAKIHNAKINLTSELNKGTTFSLVFTKNQKK